LALTLELRRKENDLTHDAIAERLLRTHGVEADKSMLPRFPPRGSASKKTVHASEQDRPDVAERREAWRRAQKSLGGRLIFLDETWTTTTMTRRNAWADVGARATGHAPNGHWKTTAFLAGRTCEGLIAPFVLDGPINAECFLAYVEQILLPERDGIRWNRHRAARILRKRVSAFVTGKTGYHPSGRSPRACFSGPCSSCSHRREA
jgi:hypothetical protein